MSDPATPRRRSTSRRGSTRRTSSTDAVAKNRRFWQSIAVRYERRHEPSLRRKDGEAWGFWRIPERELQLLGPVRGRRILELGCGAARWSIGLRRRGARPVGLDVSSARLRHAASVQRTERIWFPLIVGDAERLPFSSGKFDIVFCDWGAMTFCDPYRTVPEVARVLRSGGVFAFSTSSPLRHLFHNPRTERIGRRLLRGYFDLHRVDFADEVNFALPYGEWVRVFLANGFAIERLIEPRGGSSRPTTYLTRSERVWSGKFPLEMLWRLRRAGSGPARPHGKAHGRARSRRSHG